MHRAVEPAILYLGTPVVLVSTLNEDGTAVPSERVGAPRLLECPVQLEAVLTSCHPLGRRDPARPTHLLAIEVEIVRAHVEERLLVAGEEDRIDPDAWRPLIMSFCRFYGLGGEVHPSRLAEIPESAYRRSSPEAPPA